MDTSTPRERKTPLTPRVPLLDPAARDLQEDQLQWPQLNHGCMIDMQHDDQYLLDVTA